MNVDYVVAENLIEAKGMIFKDHQLLVIFSHDNNWYLATHKGMDMPSFTEGFLTRDYSHGVQWLSLFLWTPKNPYVDASLWVVIKKRSPYYHLL